MDVEYKDFHAYRDHMSHTIRVVGTCVVKGGGVAVSLRPHEGNTGSNPKMLVLDLSFQVTAENPSEQQVEWRGDWDDERYDQVELRVEGATVDPPPILDFETLQ
jgi:hypothetical protein